ncbi:hypothetical protein BLS_010134 [Venturia inaequalis]|uniref:Uncharacterized protein n=1 Tax=Venturia inaequalis TaxID=5025 RepID=A0A8H3U3S8_VENIN|nr:hypothetical protein BLS_010134 [Venturia inaequalis]KAE9974808.1 hypothetical protein EG328_003594 [Venturia inaequalis]
MQPQESHRDQSRTHTRELADFNRKRRHNALRLKNRFTDIIERYGHDFEDVGDVIDLGTGRVVVDNGHLSNMERELDPAYDLCAWGEDENDEEEEEGEGGFVVDEEEIDELGFDMLTEGEIEALRTGSVKMDDEGDVVLNEEREGPLVSREENMDMALVTLPPAELPSIPLGEQKKFEAPMFPQLEMAVNSMTSMLQQQMMAMLGQVIPQHTTPQPLPESRQILPATAPHTSLKRRFHEMTPAHSVEPDRFHTESPEPRTFSPKSYALKRRRIIDTQEKREGQSKGALGRRLHSSPIRVRVIGTPQAQTHEASLRKTPKTMPARPQRSMALRSPKVKDQMRVESESSPTRLILKISQLLPDDDTSEDELSSLLKPLRVEGSAKKASSPKSRTLERSSLKDDSPKATSPKADAQRIPSPAAGTSRPSTPSALPLIDNAQTPASTKENTPTASSPKVNPPKLPSSTPTRQPSPRVLIVRRPVTASGSLDRDKETMPASVVQSPKPKRDRTRKSRSLISERRKESESLLQSTKDGLTKDSDVEPPQTLHNDENMLADDDENKSPNEIASEVTAETVPEAAPRKISNRRRRTELDKLLAEAEQYTSMSKSVQDFMDSRKRPTDRARIVLPITIESEAFMTMRVTKSAPALIPQRRPEIRRTSVGNHIIKNEEEPGENGTISPEAAPDGHVTIVDMTSFKDASTHRGKEATPRGQSALETAAASSGTRGSRGRVFARKAKIIPDSQEEEEDIIDDKDVETNVERARWVEDPNSQLVIE